MSIVPRERQDGSTSYQVRVTVRGRRHPAETFPTLKEARARKAELVGARGFMGSREPCDRFAERWHDDYPIVKSGPTRGRRKGDGTNKTNRYYLKPFIERFKGVPLNELDRQMARPFAVAHPRSAAVARNLFADALDDGLVQTNPFASMGLEQSKGRKDHDPLRESEVLALADLAVGVHEQYGQTFRALILMSYYVGSRLGETLGLERDQINFAESEVTFKRAKFDKTRTVLLLPEAHVALKSYVPLISTSLVFTSKTGKPLTKTNHYALWNPVRHAFWASLSEQRRRAVVDLDWHSLRHAAGYLFYVERGFTAAETAHQLGHADESLIVSLYGHGKAGALERMKAKARNGMSPVSPERVTSEPHGNERSA